MWPYYRSAKRGFIKGNKIATDLVNHAIKYEYKLPLFDLCSIYEYDTELYHKLDDEYYGQDKLACSIYKDKKKEVQQLYEYGVSTFSPNVE